jgi:hypothetical protein
VTAFAARKENCLAELNRAACSSMQRAAREKKERMGERRFPCAGGSAGSGFYRGQRSQPFGVHATHESHDDPSSTSCRGSGTASLGWADLPSRADGCSQILVSSALFGSAEPTQTYLFTCSRSTCC